MIALAVPLTMRSRLHIDPLVLDAGADNRKLRAVMIAVGLTAVILVGLTLLSFFANRTLAAIGSDAALTIRVTGHQWWWEVRYEDATPSRILTTANEIHIPAGEPVRLLLTSTDVIHSFWVPSLSGKLHLVPGRMH
ncbi:cytochrome c oxidase subunit II, partial [Mesorhizobium sp. M4B.F.Ca.ET.190.01.1.1]